MTAVLVLTLAGLAIVLLGSLAVLALGRRRSYEQAHVTTLISPPSIIRGTGDGASSLRRSPDIAIDLIDLTQPTVDAATVTRVAIVPAQAQRRSSSPN